MNSQIQDTINKNNIAITTFLGYRLAPCSRGQAWESPFQVASKDKLELHGRLLSTSLHHMKFHNSWEWLMYAIEKIEQNAQSTEGVKIEKTKCTIKKSGMVFKAGKGGSKIAAVYLTVAEYCKWHIENYSHQYKN